MGARKEVIPCPEPMLEVNEVLEKMNRLCRVLENSTEYRSVRGRQTAVRAVQINTDRGGRPRGMTVAQLMAELAVLETQAAVEARLPKRGGG